MWFSDIKWIDQQAMFTLIRAEENQIVELVYNPWI